MNDRHDALRWLLGLGAPPRLLQHAEDVVKAADLILAQLKVLGVKCDARLVELGATLHDAGKVVHREELSDSGSRHEAAGRELLLAHGLPDELARFCVMHARWTLP